MTWSKYGRMVALDGVHSRLPLTLEVALGGAHSLMQASHADGAAGR
jgi:hypothetical protein